MNMLSKKVILPLAAVAFIGAAAFSATVASAADDTGTQTSLVQKLADTFHVDKSKVQAVFDEHHTEKRAEMEKRYEERLTQAVTDGKITVEQKTKLLAKHEELVAKMEAQKDTFQDKTHEERRAAMEAHRTELETWAKDNDIDIKWLAPMGGHHVKFGGPGMMGPRLQPPSLRQLN